MPGNQIPQYLMLPADKHPMLARAYDTGDVRNVQDRLDTLLSSFKGSFTVTGLPSLDWQLSVPSYETKPPRAEYLVVPIRIDEAVFDQFRHTFIGTEGESAIGADLSAGTGEYWCPATPEQALFGTRRQAGNLIHAGTLHQNELFGDNVNVVVVDHGLDQRFVTNFQGGWQHINPYNSADIHFPGMTVGSEAEHGLMMVRNIHDAAPNANIWDLPLIPPRIWDINVFINDAQAAFNQMLSDIMVLSTVPRWSGPWILVNGWAVFDRRSERPPGDYTNRLTNPFNVAISQAVQQGRDVIFSAGNCGQFCPDGRCGPWDIGPGQSVLGANSHPDVISVGAVRTDAMWLGYSSQGPGQPNLDPKKPDFCAPSGFAETADAYTGNTGTSAACGVTAGVVAALRSRAGWGPGIVSPAQLRKTLNATTRKIQGPLWNERLGNGILDVRAAINVLIAQYP